MGDTDYAFHRGRVAVMGVAEEAEDEKSSAEELKRASDAASTAETSKKPPVAYTVCAPQLLHLGVDGSPLWFNGGLVQNKFLDRKDWEFGNFREYVAEPENTSTTTWQLLGGNKACLTGEAGLKHSLSTSEKEAIQMMMDHAKKHL